MAEEAGRRLGDHPEAGELRAVVGILRGSIERMHDDVNARFDSLEVYVAAQATTLGELRDRERERTVREEERAKIESELRSRAELRVRTRFTLAQLGVAALGTVGFGTLLAGAFHFG